MLFSGLQLSLKGTPTLVGSPQWFAENNLQSSADFSVDLSWRKISKNVYSAGFPTADRTCVRNIPVVKMDKSQQSLCSFSLRVMPHAPDRALMSRSFYTFW